MSDQTITSLIEKLEGAEGPSLVLDGEIWCTVNGYTFVMWDGAGCVYRRASDGGISHEQASSIRPFSASLDAALALAARVLPRWGWDIGYPARLGEHGGRPWADCWPPVEDGEVAPFRLGGPRPTHRHVNAATMALAVCSSLLRAQSEARATGEDSPANEGEGAS